MLNRLLFIVPIAIAVSLTLPKTVIADELQDKVKLQEALSSFNANNCDHCKQFDK